MNEALEDDGARAEQHDRGHRNDHKKPDAKCSQLGYLPDREAPPEIKHGASLPRDQPDRWAAPRPLDTIGASYAEQRYPHQLRTRGPGRGTK